MTDHRRVLRVTEQIREEVFQRALGRAPDDRYDFIIDALEDFSDDLAASDSGPTEEPQKASQGYSGQHTPPDAVILGKLTQINEWIDEHPSLAYETQPLAQHWARVAKVAEEVGEAVDALISWTGQNPRKPQQEGAFFELLNELCDAALTAILAIIHFDMDAEGTFDLLWSRLDFLHERMLATPDRERTPMDDYIEDVG